MRNALDFVRSARKHVEDQFDGREYRGSMDNIEARSIMTDCAMKISIDLIRNLELTPHLSEAA